MSEAEKKLRLAIERRARAWVDVYKQEPDGELLVKSLLLGMQSRIRERIGTMTDAERNPPRWAITRAYGTGREIAEHIPPSILSPFEKS